MADQIVKSEIAGAPYPWYALWRLFETMVAAGWTVTRSSDGTTFGAGDNWSGAGYAGLGADSWVLLTANSGQQILFHRSGSSLTDGFIRWSKGGGFTSTGESATAPPDSPADIAEVRGTGKGGSSGEWFGYTVGIDRLYIGCRDAGGVGDETFWIVTKTWNVALTGTGIHGYLAFEKLLGTEAGDTAPYAWLAPPSLTGAWTEGLDDLDCIVRGDNAGGTQGCWWRWWNAGQAGETFKCYGSAALYQGTGTRATAGDEPMFEEIDDKLIYTASTVPMLRRVRLMKAAETAYKDANGGFTTNILFAGPDVPNAYLLNTGQYAKLGNWMVVWWDLNSTEPPRE